MGTFGNTFGDALGTSLGREENTPESLLKSMLAPQVNYGMYVQQGATARNIHIFSPIDTEANCIVHSIQPPVIALDGIEVVKSGITKGYYISLPTSKTGTFLGGDTKSAFASVAGSTVTLNFTGTSIYLYSYTDNRGGYWNFSVDGGAAIKITRWASSGAYVLTKIADSLAYGSHTVVGTFMGDDPDHIPSGGAGTGRGWICLNNASSGAEFHYKSFYVTDYLNCNYIGQGDFPAMDYVLSPGSIRSFAWKIRKNGEIYALLFVPDHSASACVSYDDVATDRVFAVDNVNIDLTATTYTYATKCSKVHFHNKFNGFNANDPTEILLNVVEEVDFYYNGIKINVAIDTLQDVYTDTSYISMMPFGTTQFDNFITAQGNEYACVKTDGSSTTIIENTSLIEGYVTNKSGSAELKKNLMGFKITSSDPYHVSDGFTKKTFIEHRDASMQKVYLQIAQNQTISAGTKYNFTTYYMMNKLTDAYNVIVAKFRV